MKIIAREELDYMPCDKRFNFNGSETFCHATGYEVAIIDIGEPNDELTWWNEYVLPNGSIVYGRQKEEKHMFTLEKTI